MSTNFPELVALDAVAVRHSVDLVDGITPADLSRPTPCAEWTLGDLLAHMTAQHRGFAAAVGGAGTDRTPWAVQPLGDDPAAAYREAATRLLATFAAVDEADRPCVLPEFHPTATLPAATVIGFHLVDYLVHAWDVAVARSLPFHPDPALVDAALPVVLSVPDDSRRLDPDSPFGPALPVSAGADPMQQILALLGRRPHPPRP